MRAMVSAPACWRAMPTPGAPASAPPVMGHTISLVKSSTSFGELPIMGMPASAQAWVPSAPKRYRPTTAMTSWSMVSWAQCRAASGSSLPPAPASQRTTSRGRAGPPGRVGDPAIGVDRGDGGVGGFEDLRLGDDARHGRRGRELDRLTLELRHGRWFRSVRGVGPAAATVVTTADGRAQQEGHHQQPPVPASVAHAAPLGENHDYGHESSIFKTGMKDCTIPGA